MVPITVRPCKTISQPVGLDTFTEMKGKTSFLTLTNVSINSRPYGHCGFKTGSKTIVSWVWGYMTLNTEMTIFTYLDSLCFHPELIYSVWTCCLFKSSELVSFETGGRGFYSNKLFSLLCLCQKVLYNIKTCNGVGGVLSFHHKHGDDHFFSLVSSRQKLELSLNPPKVRHFSSSCYGRS